MCRSCFQSRLHMHAQFVFEMYSFIAANALTCTCTCCATCISSSCTHHVHTTHCSAHAHRSTHALYTCGPVCDFYMYVQWFCYCTVWLMSALHLLPVVAPLYYLMQPTDPIISDLAGQPTDQGADPQGQGSGAGEGSHAVQQPDGEGAWHPGTVYM